MNDTVIDLTLSDDAGDSPYSPMSELETLVPTSKLASAQTWRTYLV